MSRDQRNGTRPLEQMSELRWRHHMLTRQRNRCFYCKRRIGMRASPQQVQATIDHFIPRALGGKNARWNKVLACGGCNNDKGHRLPTSGEIQRFYALTGIRIDLVDLERAQEHAERLFRRQQEDER